MIETLRRQVRERLGYRSLAYRLASDLYTDVLTILREGIGVYVELRRLRAADSAMPPIAVRFSSLDHPLTLRPGTRDISAVLNNIVRREYGKYCPAHRPSVMVDAGAYIGDTSAYFLSRFPELKVYALEPNPISFEMARHNLQPYGSRAILIPAALCGSVGHVRIAGLETAARIDPDSGLEVEATTVPALLRQIPERFIDVLKIDIEGAEDEVFSSDLSKWLPKVGMLIIETHGPEITDRVLSTLNLHGWTFHRYRNLYYCIPKCE